MARSAIYSLLSLGVRSIYICNRTKTNALALAEHYNGLIESGQLPELGGEDASQARIHLLESFDATWPKDARLPTMVISCIPRHAADQPPAKFALPADWLKSPTAGVVLEVSYRQTSSSVLLTLRALDRLR